jgi:hypothetical protein
MFARRAENTLPITGGEQEFSAANSKQRRTHMWKALAIIVSTGLVFGVGAVSVPADGGRTILKMNGYEVTIVQNGMRAQAMCAI